MATKSILKDVVIKDKRLAGTFINALESVSSNPYKGMIDKPIVKEASRETITELFDHRGK